jgi:hypothetical protein
MAEEQSVKLQVRGFEDPLVGYVAFDAFDNPIIALEKLRERPVRGRMGSMPEENGLKAGEFEDFPGTMIVRFDKESGQVTKLLGTFDPDKPMSLQSFKEDLGFRLVVNHEEQYS